ncbi:MAG: GerMN domain-containing protein [Spirochaetaceae bacterium]|nr:GerMN domain-containing protein [Spirochaetaceae bacterium]
MAERKRSSSRSGGSTGCLLWIGLVCVVALLYLLNSGRIAETLKRTNFKEIVKTQRGTEDLPVPPTAPGLPAAKTPTPADKATEVPAARPEDPAPEDAKRESPAEKPAAEAAKPQPKPAEKPVPEAPTVEKPAAKPLPAKPAAAKSRNAVLYFVRIDDDGVIVRQEVKRQIPATDSPLLDSFAALLKGPSEEELRRNLLSLVPQGTVLLSAQVRGSTAFLNFNEAFMYNRYGIEGYAGQLKQIVYTATSFPTVQDVQILIEGERHDYLGGEGVYIGRPLSRNSF